MVSWTPTELGMFVSLKCTEMIYTDEITVPSSRKRTHMCSKLDTVCTVCKKLQSAGTTHKKKKKAKSKGGGTVGQQTEAKLLRKQSKAYKKLGNYDANPKLAFEI